MNKPVLTLVCMAWLLCPASHAAFTETDIDQMVAASARYEIGASREALGRIDELIKTTPPGSPLRHRLEQQIVAAFKGGATDEAKRWFCRHLWLIGTDASLPVLEPMLLNPETSHFAGYAMLNYPGRKVDAILRTALEKAPAKAQLDIINILGDRRDGNAVKLLAGLAKAGQGEQVLAALAALGRIGSTAASEALETLDSAGPNQLPARLALLQCAQRLAQAGKFMAAQTVLKRLHKTPGSPQIERAAFLGLVALGGPEASSLVLQGMKNEDAVLQAAAIAQIPQLRDSQINFRCASVLPSLKPEARILLIEALAKRGDPAAKTVITPLLSGQSAEVSIAALAALGKLGDASLVPSIIQTAAALDSKPALEAATASLRALKDPLANEAILRELPKTTAGLRAGIIETLASREAVEAVPVLLEQTGSADARVSRAAFRALAQLAGPKHLDAVAQRLSALTDRNLENEGEQAVIAVAQKLADVEKRAGIVLNVYATTTGTPARQALLRVLGTLGGEKALTAMLVAARDNPVRETALRALATWPDASGIKPALERAQAISEPTLQILLVQGSLQMLASATNWPPAERLQAYSQAMELAKRPEEKRLALSGLAEAALPGSLKLVQALLENPSVRVEACLAVVKIVKATPATDRANARLALEKVVAVCPDAKLVQEARTLLDTLK